VNDHASSGRELLVTHVTLEVLGLLVLYQHLLILKLTLTVKAPHHVRLLLLLPHRRTRLIDAHTTTHRQPNPKEDLSSSSTTTTTSSHQTWQQKNLAPTNLPQKKLSLPQQQKLQGKNNLTLPQKKKKESTKKQKKFPTQQPKKNSRQRTPKCSAKVRARTNSTQRTLRFALILGFLTPTLKTVYQPPYVKVYTYT
jgi:hypothetical protein